MMEHNIFITFAAPVNLTPLLLRQSRSIATALERRSTGLGVTILTRTSSVTGLYAACALLIPVWQRETAMGILPSKEARRPAID